ncbi:molybdopterin-containing oxidoreductase family protein [Hippea jasoniae]|uniref:molybdopterin-containing oxidoreductase family protein n=1 Tax=Hippea jasoniae TaxID=944479 RepID=UPI0005596539|nr:molybdopterin-dependent oxidoreductase [Hippea jasoniae]
MAKNISRRAFIKTAVVGGSAIIGLSALNSNSIASSKTKSYEEKIVTYDRGKKSFNFCEMCFWNCGVIAYTRNGIVHKLEGNPHNPNNRGYLCAKGNAGIYTLYDPNRLKYPMMRVGKRGEGKFKKVSWKEAFDYIADKLKFIQRKYSSKSIASFLHGTGEEPFIILSKALGTPNIIIPAYSQCMGSREVGWVLTYGTGVSGHSTFDFKNSKYIISFGRNILGALQVREAEDLIEGISRGGKLVYVDPRFSETAAKAYKWLQINPGTDLALILSLIHVLIRDQLVNMDFVDKYCIGFGQLSNFVKQYTPEWAEAETGISAKLIEKIAWEYAENAPNVLAVPPRRFSRYGNDTQTSRAIAILNALAGNWGVPGGIWVRDKFAYIEEQYNSNDCEIIKVPFRPPKEDEPPLVNEERADGAGSEYPLAPKSLGRENGIIEATRTAKPYPIKAWIIYGTNPISSSAIGVNRLTEEVLNKLELIVDIDIIPNDTSMYADIILPESTYLERYDLPHIQKDAYPFIAIREPAVKPLFDTKVSWDIAKGIADRLGLGKYFKETVKERTEKILSKLPSKLKKELEEKGVIVFEGTDPYPQASGKKLTFKTPSGKIELYSTKLEKLYKEKGDAYYPLPKYIPPVSIEDKSLFRLLFGRVPVHTHARTQNNKLLAELYGKNEVWINKKDAERLGLTEKSKVVLSNPKTGVKSPVVGVKITNRIKEGCLFIAHGFGHISKFLDVAYKKGISDAQLCSDGVDPISGAAAFNNSFVKITKVRS